MRDVVQGKRDAECRYAGAKTLSVSTNTAVIDRRILAMRCSLDCKLRQNRTSEKT